MGTYTFVCSGGYLLDENYTQGFQNLDDSIGFSLDCVGFPRIFIGFQTDFSQRAPGFQNRAWVVMVMVWLLFVYQLESTLQITVTSIIANIFNHTLKHFQNFSEMDRNKNKSCCVSNFLWWMRRRKVCFESSLQGRRLGAQGPRRHCGKRAPNKHPKRRGGALTPDTLLLIITIGWGAVSTTWAHLYVLSTVHGLAPVGMSARPPRPFRPCITLNQFPAG